MTETKPKQNDISGSCRSENESGNVRITPGLLARNSLCNFTGQFVSALLSFAVLPYVIFKLGNEQYGIYALVLLVVEYFSIFEFGVGAAGTKFITEALGRNEKVKIRPIFFTALSIVTVLGLAGAITCLSISSFLAERVFKISGELTGEAKMVFGISSLLIIVFLMRSVLNGILEAYQRFDLINILKVPSNILTALIPLFVLSIGYGLRLIMLIFIIKEITVLCGYYYFSIRQMPRTGKLFEMRCIRPLLSFGGWLCVVRGLGLLLLTIEPFLIGALISVQVVPYYAIPYKVTGAMLMLPSSIIIVLFPAFSMLNEMDTVKLRKLFSYSMKYITVILGLPAIILIIFSQDILSLWMGPDYEKSAMVMRLLAAGTLFSGLSWVLGTFLTGTGHPKVPAIFGMIQVPVYIVSAWWLIKNYGIDGAAAGWAAQKFIQTFILYALCVKLKLAEWSWKINIVGNSRILKAVTAILLVLIANLFVKYFCTQSVAIIALNAFLMVIAYMFIVWRYIIDIEQRNTIIRKLTFLISPDRA